MPEQPIPNPTSLVASTAMPSAPGIVHVAAVTPAMADAIHALQVADGHYAYVGDIGMSVDDALGDPRSEAMAILRDDAVVGYYRLDHARTIVTRRPLPCSVGLRAFVIDASLHGRGLGRRGIAACCADLAARHRAARVLALNVHCRNVAAVRIYRSAGFIDSGELVFGGSAGPQHVMLRRLP